MRHVQSLSSYTRFALHTAYLVTVLTGIIGCGGGNSGSSSSGGNTSSGSTNTGPAQSIYVVQAPTGGSGTILEFPATSSGAVSPSATIAPGLPVGQVATDQAGNIYIATTSDIREYATGATGVATPIRTLPVNATTGIYAVDGLAVSPAGEIVIGQDGGDVDEWSATQMGSAAPERRIPGTAQTGGGLSQILVANQVAIDGSGNIYVAPEGGPPLPPKVAIFGPTANGNVAPIRTVGGTGTAAGVTIDSAGNIYTASSNCVLNAGPPSTESCSGTISEYSASAGANDPPVRTISGSASQLGNLNGIKVDAAGNIYVISTTVNLLANPTTTNPTVLKFAATATGNVAPTSSFTSGAWTTPDFNPSLALH